MPRNAPSGLQLPWRVGGPRDLPSGQGNQFSKDVFVHAYRHTALAVNERFATEKSTFFFLLTSREACPLLLHPPAGTAAVWHNSSSSSEQRLHRSNVAEPSANQKDTLDWVAVQAHGWGETMQTYREFHHVPKLWSML